MVRNRRGRGRVRKERETAVIPAVILRDLFADYLEVFHRSVSAASHSLPAVAAQLKEPVHFQLVYFSFDGMLAAPARLD